MMTSHAQSVLDTTPKPRVYLEKIGATQWELREEELDVLNEVALWHANPRLLPYNSAAQNFVSEQELESWLGRTKGYDDLRKSIEQIGQMEPIYVWRKDDASKFIVFEGATRVAILRDLSRKHAGGPHAGRFQRVKAKVLPSHFNERDRAILLARIHVRGSGVRSWGRYIEAKFIHDNVVGADGKASLMSASDMAMYMEKSISWVVRLRDAYEFARKFVDHVDDGTGEKKAVEQFSTLEEISKVSTLGPLLRDYDNAEHDALRADVFDMVQNEVFKEYRDARFLKELHDDPEKWALLKAGGKHIATQLAAEIKQNASSLKTRIAGLESAVERALQRDDHGLDEDDVEHLRGAISLIQQRLHSGIERFRLDIKTTTKMLSNTTLADVKALPANEVDDLRQAMEYFEMLVGKYGQPA